MRRRWGMLVLAVFFALFFTCIGLAVYNRLTEIKAYDRAVKASIAIKEQIVRLEVPPEQSDDGEPLPAETAPPYIEVNGQRYIGTLRIPALAIELPINDEVSEEKLKDSPCRYYGSIDSTLVISGHNYERHFGGIKDLLPGNTVIVYDTAGIEHSYSVELVTELDGTDIEGMIHSPYDLTLFTCTKSRTERVTVRCTRLEPLPVTEETPAPVIEVAANAPAAPSYKIDYKKEIIRLRKGVLYSLDGGYTFTEITSMEGAVADVSDCITKGIPVYIRKASTYRKPASQPQMIEPLPRQTIVSEALPVADGRFTLDKQYEVYNPLSGKWGALPTIKEDSELAIRLKSTAADSGGTISGLAASLPGQLTLVYGETSSGAKGILVAFINGS